MTRLNLLDALTSFTNEVMREILLPVRRQKGDEAEPAERPPLVYRQRLPDIKSATAKAPYILHQIVTGEDTQKPVISEMILACRVPVNVLFADTKSVEGAAYGHMIFELPNDEHDAEKVVSWLKNSGLTWKEER